MIHIFIILLYIQLTMVKTSFSDFNRGEMGLVAKSNRYFINIICCCFDTWLVKWFNNRHYRYNKHKIIFFNEGIQAVTVIFFKHRKSLSVTWKIINFWKILIKSMKHKSWKYQKGWSRNLKHSLYACFVFTLIKLIPASISVSNQIVFFK